MSWPRLVITFWIVLAGVSGLGVTALDVETSTDSILDRSGTPWSTYQKSLDRFGGDEIVTLLIESSEPFSREAFEEVVRLTEMFSDLEGVRRVDSLATVPLVRSIGDGEVSLEPGLDNGAPITSEGRALLVGWLQGDRIAPDLLMSRDGRFFGVNLVLERGAEEHYDGILSTVREELQGRVSWVSGVPVFRIEADSRTRKQLAIYTPITLTVMGILLYVLFGSIGAVLIPIVCSGVATWCVIGSMGALGVPITITTVVLPSILLALGCAYNMHLLTAFCSGRSREEGLTSLHHVALPVALSGLTTAVGFIAVSFVRIDAIRDIGAFGALGVVIVLAATLTGTPAALRLWPTMQRTPRFQVWLSNRGAAWIVAVVERRSRLILAGWIVALAGVGIGIAQISVETDVVVWFDESDPIRSAYTEIRENLSGISPMNVVVDAPPGRSVADPDLVEAIDGLSSHLQSLGGVGKTISIADPLREMHGAFLDDSADPLPDTKPLISQYLILLEAKEYIFDLITSNRDSASIMIRADSNDSASLMQIAASASEWWASHGVSGSNVTPTGIMYEFARAEDEIAYGQLRGLGFALISVGMILMANFRSLRLALVALIPNAVPVAMAFGAMGLLGIPLDAGTVVLGNLALGIAVDDTIHVVAGFYEGTEEKRSAGEALEKAFRRVLPALMFTTAAVALGFAILGVSSFTVTRHLGLLTAGIMVLCLLADVFLLPSLLLKLGRNRVAATTVGSLH